MEQLYEYVTLKIPASFIGKWVITEEYGTHGPIDVVKPEVNGFEFYHTKEQAEIQLIKRLMPYYPGMTIENFETFERPFDTKQVMQVSKDYPYMQIRLYTKK